MSRNSKLNLIKIKSARVVAVRSFIALLSVAIGVLITAQWRSIPDRVTNPVAPYSSLKETKDSLYTEQSQLKSEIKNLQLSIEKAQNQSQDVTLTKKELADLSTKKSQAGLTKLNGEGIIVTLDDSKTGPATEDSIVHAADLRDVVNLLWESGAEGISINNQRVVINTAIDCIVNTILVNDIRLTTPFRIEAVGNQSVMYERVSNSGILPNIHQRKSLGLIFNVDKNNDITLPVFDGSFEAKTTGGN
ncbi:MAG: DUF881 domain-containing protein [Patescibacteria group bacterium]|nr:DUF881 domain-containing protein [Patescibacteria group bacterium]